MYLKRALGRRAGGFTGEYVIPQCVPTYGPRMTLLGFPDGKYELLDGTRADGDDASGVPGTNSS